MCSSNRKSSLWQHNNTVRNFLLRCSEKYWIRHDIPEKCTTVGPLKKKKKNPSVWGQSEWQYILTWPYESIEAVTSVTASDACRSQISRGQQDKLGCEIQLNVYEGAKTLPWKTLTNTKGQTPEICLTVQHNIYSSSFWWSLTKICEQHTWVTPFGFRIYPTLKILWHN